jgi:uncharacterized protein YqeY
MSLETKINDSIKDAMRAKNKEKLAVLRAIKSEVILANTSKSGEMDESGEIKMLQKLVKQRKDSAAIYKEQGREDLASDELGQVEFIQEFLPNQMSEDDVKKVIMEIISQTGASSMADMGKVMGMASSKLAGQAEGKIISAIVKSSLS